MLRPLLLAAALPCAFTMLLSLKAGAQVSECPTYHRFNCERSGDARFSVNGQSRSAMVKIGEETELNIIVYRGQDYRISVCHDTKILGEDLAIRLVEKIRTAKPGGNKGEMVETEKVLWDNTEHDMAPSIEFSCTATKRVAVEVNAPGAAERKGKKADIDIGCVGILIEHMPSPGIGF
ncbi:MAG TPA: hypothetical protein PKY96_17235 [Flavobacteriales bacterium]|nr:hypothetical protein [Flavobacteriales bacterium]